MICFTGCASGTKWLLPKQPLARNEMTKEQFDEMMQTGLNQAKAGISRPADEVIGGLKREVDEWTANSTR